MRVEISPTLAYRLKRSLGDDQQSIEDALQKAVDLACQVRGLTTALHDALFRDVGDLPESARPYVSLEELRYAEVRMPRGKVDRRGG